jgi:hypothetical protein
MHMLSIGKPTLQAHDQVLARLSVSELKAAICYSPLAHLHQCMHAEASCNRLCNNMAARTAVTRAARYLITVPPDCIMTLSRSKRDVCVTCLFRRACLTRLICGIHNHNSYCAHNVAHSLQCNCSLCSASHAMPDGCWRHWSTHVLAAEP